MIWMFPKNCGTPKSSILIGFSIIIINYPFWGTLIFGNTHMDVFAANCFFWPLPIFLLGMFFFVSRCEANKSDWFPPKLSTF